MSDQPLDLDAIQQRVDAASPLPWTYRDVIDNLHNVTRGGWDIASCGAGDLHPDHGDRDAQAAANATFVAHSRTDIPALIARVRELEQRNATLGIERARVADALDRVAIYGRRLTEVFKPHTTHAEVGREIARHITTNPLPSEQGAQR